MVQCCHGARFVPKNQAAFERLFSCPPRAGIFTSGAFVRKVRLDLVMAVIGLITEVIRLVNKLLS